MTPTGNGGAGDLATEALAGATPSDDGHAPAGGSAALRESEIRYRRLFEEAKEGVILVDPETGRIRDANPFMAQLLGYQRDEFVGKDLFEIGLFRDAQAAQETLRQLGAEHEVHYEHLPLKAKDGADHEVDVVANLYSEDGRAAIQCNVREVTDRRRLDHERQTSEAHHRSLFEAIDEGFCIVEMLFDEAGEPIDYRFEAVNPSFAAQTGLHDVVGKRIRELVPEHESHWFEIFGRVARTAVPVRFTNEARGLQRWFDVYSFPIESAGHRSVGILFTDITERRRLERALRASERYFRELTQNLPLGVWTSNADGRVDFINDHWLAYAGLQLEQVKSHDEAWSHGIHPDDRARAATLCVEGPAYAFEARLRHAPGGAFRWFLLRSIPVCDAGGALQKRIGICIDIDEMKRAQDILAAHADELERQVQARTRELRETIGELEAFSYSVSHDMRAPLRALQGYGHVLLRTLADTLDAQSADYLRRITVSAARLDALIGDVLAYSCLLRSEMVLEPIDLAEVVQCVIATYPQLQAAGLDIKLDGESRTVMANDASLTQVLANLLTNAVKFVAPGVAPRVRIRCEDYEGDVRVCIEDNGIGIDPKDHDRIWTLCTRIGRTRDYDGTGVGLAIARKAVERMHGAIGLESALGCGSKFWFRLRAG